MGVRAHDYVTLEKYAHDRRDSVRCGAGARNHRAQAVDAGRGLPILHDLQHRFGYIDDDAIPLMAEALNISKAEVLGVVSFYPDFRRAPVDGRVLKLCRAESCQAMGCEDLVAHLEARHGIAADEASSDAGLHVETVYCLGNCALSPAALLDGEPMAGSIATASTRSFSRPGKRPRDHARLRSRQFCGAFGRRRKPSQAQSLRKRSGAESI